MLVLSEVKMFGALRIIFPVLLGGVALLYSVYGVWGYEVLLHKPDTRIQAIHWINQNVPEYARFVLDDHTLYLPLDKNGVEFMNRFHPKGLDTRTRFLLGIDKTKYPHPSYAVFDVSRAGKDQKELVDFSPDYLLYSFWTPDEMRAKENEYAFWPHKRLVAFFSPGKGNKEIVGAEDLLADPKMLYTLLPSLQFLGPSVAIYSIR